MGAWVTSTGIVLLLVLPTTVVLAGHQDPPLRHAAELPWPGWFAARFEASPGAPLQLVLGTMTQKAAFFKFVVFDENDAILGTYDSYHDGASAYVRASALGRHQEVGLEVLGGGGAAVGGEPLPCDASYGAYWASTGEEGSILEIPPVCGDRRVGGVIGVVAGNAAWDAYFQIRSWYPVNVTGSIASVGSSFVDASRFEGTSLELQGPVPFVGPTLAVASASVERNVTRGLVGAFGLAAAFGPYEGGSLRFRHDGVEGDCPCSWAGEEATRGSWRLEIEGVRTVPVYFAYADAALPPP